jgi:hypothetical protein
MSQDTAPVTLRRSNETTYDRRPKLAVWAGERLVGYVWKDEHRTHRMAPDRGLSYSIGQRVQVGWRYEASRAVAGDPQRLDHADRERARRLATPGSRVLPGMRRRDAVDELLANVETLDRLYGS